MYKIQTDTLHEKEDMIQLIGRLHRPFDWALALPCLVELRGNIRRHDNYMQILGFLIGPC